MSIIILLIAASAFLYALVKYPQAIAFLYFTITLADMNIDVAGASMRALVAVMLMLRTMIPEKGDNYPPIIATRVNAIFVFIAYTTVVTIAYDLASMQFVKITGQVIIAAYCGYHYFMKNGDYRLLKYALITASLICIGDLVHTYAVFSKFPVQRMYHYLLGIPQEVDENGDFIEKINHNFYGQVCAMCFVFILHEFTIGREKLRTILILLPLLFLGVLMSTSRSSLLGLIGISLFLIGLLFRSKNGAQMAMKLTMIGLGSLTLAIMMFIFAQEVLDIRSAFAEQITMRLIDEPVAVFQKQLGMNYNAQSLDAMDWREEASADAFNAYLRLKPIEQLFGIGYWGFVIRDLGHTQLPPHNGFLLLLIETGLVGFIAYMSLILSLIAKSIKTIKGGEPTVTVVIFILIYCIGQNGELTSGSTFLFVVSIIGELLYREAQLKYQRKQARLTPKLSKA